MIPLIGTLTRAAAVDTIPTLNVGRFGNITNMSFNGTGTGNVTPPDWTGLLFQSFGVYTDAFGYSFLIIFACPFVMLYISTGSLKMPGVVGIFVCLLAFAFLPSSVIAFAAVCMVISISATIWGVFKE